MRFLVRLVLLAALLWAAGFGIFVATMPGPLEGVTTDAVVVPTGGAGRIDRGLRLIEQHAAKRMLVTGVAPSVRPAELAAQYRGYGRLFACSADLGHDAVDTRSNADETAAWLKAHGYKTVRLVTSDWHLARARLELVNALGSDVTVVGDGVATRPKFLTLLSEYNKLIVRRVAILSGGLL